MFLLGEDREKNILTGRQLLSNSLLLAMTE